MSPPIPESPAGAASGRGRIIVVDDEPTLRMGFRLALLTEGYEVEMASDGEHALARIAQEPFDLMVLDLRMPGIDGIGVLRSLAERDCFLPTIVSSAHMDSAIVTTALALGAVDFLSKPVRPVELRDIVRLVLEEEHSFTSDPSGLDPVVRARCLLRRRAGADASAVLAEAPEKNRASDLWRRVTAHEPVTLQEVLQWASSPGS